MKYTSAISKLRAEYEARARENADAFARLRDELEHTRANHDEFLKQQAIIMIMMIIIVIIIAIIMIIVITRWSTRAPTTTSS